MQELTLERTAPESVTGQAPLALVVDDDITNRLILGNLLSRLGYRVAECVNGADAVAACAADPVDIVFMDVMMPVLDGIEAARTIKAGAGLRFVPIIFLTALQDDDTFSRCLEAGGDDFMTKPYSVGVLRAKICALQRIQQLHDRVARLHASQLEDERIAEQLFSRAVSAGNFDHPAIVAERRPAARFSGDVYLSARAPSGEVYVLLGDFTGHGLTAAIGALPVSEVFRAMTAKGFPPEQILRSINLKLNSLFPTGVFMAAQFIAIDPELKFLRVANCGMPDIHVFSPQPGGDVTAIVSHSIALGISRDLFLRDGVRSVPVIPGSRVLLASDGLLEAVDDGGTMFGTERALAAMRAGLREGGSGLARVLADLQHFCGSAPQIDDITAVEVCCSESLVAATPPTPSPPVDRATVRSGWELELMVRGPSLTSINPVPLLMNQLTELSALEGTHSELFTVLSELYVNALDHGVLELESAIKDQPGGIETYMMQRQQRLAELADGWVRFAVRSQPEQGRNGIDITVSDSGSGFDIDEVEARALASTADKTLLPHGRGIALLRALCAEVRYLGRGNVAAVHYRWRD